MSPVLHHGFARAPSSQLREKQCFSPLVRHRYRMRITAPHLSLDEWVKAGFANSDRMKFAKKRVCAVLGERREYFDIAPLRGWQQTLKSDVEQRFGVACERLACNGGEPLPDKFFALQGSHLERDPVVTLQNIYRPEGAVAIQGGRAISWEDFKRRVAARVCATLPQQLGTLKASAQQRPCEVARRFVRSRQQMTSWARDMLQSPTLVVPYGSNSSNDEATGEQQWMGAELQQHPAVDAALSQEVRRQFDLAHQMTPQAYDEVAGRVAVECFNALGTHFDQALYNTKCAPDQSMMRDKLQAHIGALLESGTFELSQDRCNCSKRHPELAQREQQESAADRTRQLAGIDASLLGDDASSAHHHHSIDGHTRLERRQHIRDAEHALQHEKRHLATLEGGETPGSIGSPIKSTSSQKERAETERRIKQLEGKIESEKRKIKEHQYVGSDVTAEGPSGVDYSRMPALVPLSSLLSSELPALIPLSNNAPVGSELPALVPASSLLGNEEDSDDEDDDDDDTPIGLEVDYSQMPALMPLNTRLVLPALVPISSEMPALIPLGTPLGTEMPALVPLGTELPPLEQISDEEEAGSDVEEESANAVTNHITPEPVPQVVAQKQQQQAEVSISNFEPLLRRYALTRKYDDLVALAPTNDVFTAENARAIAALNKDAFATAMNHYFAPHPGQGVVATAQEPLKLRMFSGAELSLTYDKRIVGVAQPQVLKSYKIGNAVVYAHRNLLGPQL